MAEVDSHLDEEAEIPLPWWMRSRHALGSYFTSSLIHLLILLIMALYIIPISGRESGLEFAVDTVIESPVISDSLENFSIVPHAGESLQPVPQDVSIPAQKIVENPGTVEINLDVKELLLAAETAEVLEGLPQAGEFGGRTDKGRAAMSRAFGGNAGSEAAVANGLEWLKAHQREDGSWSFDHRCPHCDESCSHPGSLGNATVASTAMAMLCFVGAGHTHRKGAYQPQVRKGLDFIFAEAAKTSPPGDLRQITSGNSGMYTQGIVTILLCELHGLTRDREVGKLAFSCMKFIVDAQHPKTGGWRYQPGEEQGDTSVVGWQVMAQTSAKMSRITVSAKSRKLASTFLDSVQLEDGAFYGYTSPSKSPSTTAIGLLCRMYQGWGKDHPGLQKGVKFLSDHGPSRDNMYFNYYATQVMRHWGGEEWNRWNVVMRELLVQTQTKEGHGLGSWAPRDPHGHQGGRHYMTCLAILTLEVYYRHLPIYQQLPAE
ncbi:prenyltransferase/squalene oxidase repeat-containing protein [Planctomicrobium sp. SH661]|uniref:prenyltransferase/squalene oxidase repeat-containing protein n=1 Tax=Planctomicrobium sp. SH661 TaxID=3448124 RepID=UPI003F5BAE68